MSQNILVKPVAKQTLLSLNIRNVTDLFPGFALGDFAVIYGPSVTSLTSLLCVRAQLPTQLGGLGSNVIFIDGGNTFRLYQVTRFAQLQHLDPKKTLEKIFVSRAFTAYQLTALIMERLKCAIEEYDAKVVIVSDVAGLFLDKDIPDEEAEQVYAQIIAYLQNLARQNQIVLIATCVLRPNSSRWDHIKTVTSQKANVVLALRQTPYDREVTLDKHPYLMLGSVELPSENVTLTDFIAGNKHNLTISP